MDAPADEPIFEWTVHLARRRPGLAVVGGVAFLAIAVVAGYVQQSVPFALVAAAVLIGSTAPFWLPRRYGAFSDRLEVRSVALGRSFAYPWSRFRSCVGDGSTLFLSPFERPTRLAKYRGLVVFLPPDATAIRDFIERRIAGNSRDATPSETH